MSRTNRDLADIWATEPNLIVVDASGVLYTDDGPIPGMGDTIRTMSAKVPVWVATNNTTNSVPEIAKHLHYRGIDIPESRIISSGLGLVADPHLHRLVQGSAVYTMGYPTSSWYATHAGGHPVGHPDDADVIVLAASTGPTTQGTLDRIRESIQKRHRPVICVNPDYYVQTGSGLYPVMGYYAAQLALDIPDMIWMGKPYSSFSDVVRHYLKSANLTLDSQTWFFDDNPKNVAQLTRDLGISGATIMDTGLCKGLSLPDIDATFGRVPAIRVPSLTL